MDREALLRSLSFGAQVAEEETNELAEYFVNSGVLLNQSHEQNSKQITMTTHGYARVSTDGAQLAAKNEVKNQIRAQGLRLHEFTAKEITLRAEAWLEANPEMIAEARAKAAKFGWV